MRVVLGVALVASLVGGCILSMYDTKGCENETRCDGSDAVNCEEFTWEQCDAEARGKLPGTTLECRTITRTTCGAGSTCMVETVDGGPLARCTP